MQSSTAKDLPPTPPPEPISAKDRVEMLEAKQEQLFTRKRNNSRIRVELTEALRRNAIVYDLYKRKEVGSRIKELELELDEIAQEEHEVGVLLHRAQKKRDNAVSLLLLLVLTPCCNLPCLWRSVLIQICRMNMKAVRLCGLPASHSEQITMP